MQYELYFLDLLNLLWINNYFIGEKQKKLKKNTHRLNRHEI